MEEKRILTVTDALRKYFNNTNGVEPAGQSIVEVISNAADDYDFGSLVLTVTPATDTDDLFDKQASDLQENIHIGENAITGTLKYVTGYQAYAGDEQNGNFLALKAVANKDNCLIKAELIGGIHGQVNLESDGLIILRVTSTSQSVRFTVIKNGKSKVYDYALTSIVLAEPAPATATLTYAVGSYADEGSECPDPVTAEVGTPVSIDFSPAPTREGYNFIGWKIGNEDAASPDFSEGGTETYTLSADVTLYPVFEAAGGDEGFTIDATGSSVDIEIYYYDELNDEYSLSETIYAGTSDNFTFNSDLTYTIRFKTSMSVMSAMFTGSYNETEYQDESLAIQNDGGATVISAPDYEAHWVGGLVLGSGSLVCTARDK